MEVGEGKRKELHSFIPEDLGLAEWLIVRVLARMRP
jgi:hypothetical protein